MMTIQKICIALPPALILLGCSPAHTPQDEQQTATVRSPEPDPDTAPAHDPAPAKPAAEVDDGNRDLKAPQLTPEAERGEKGARNLLLSFGRAIERKKFDQAWAMLSPSDKNKWSKPQFAAIFSDLSEISVAMPSGTIEGAAGSLYYSAPLTITASDKDGRPVRLEGTAVVRRVNDVDGATPAQLRWHFETVTLDWQH